MWIKTEFRSSLSTETVSLLSLDIILTRDVNVANYLYLMSLFLLKESHVLMKETRAINISILKTIVFFVNFF